MKGDHRQFAGSELERNRAADRGQRGEAAGAVAKALATSGGVFSYFQIQFHQSMLYHQRYEFFVPPSCLMKG
jgi:hypothetical protein